MHCIALFALSYTVFHCIALYYAVFHMVLLLVELCYKAQSWATMLIKVQRFNVLITRMWWMLKLQSHSVWSVLRSTPELEVLPPAKATLDSPSSLTLRSSIVGLYWVAKFGFWSKVSLTVLLYKILCSARCSVCRERVRDLEPLKPGRVVRFKGGTARVTVVLEMMSLTMICAEMCPCHFEIWFLRWWLGSWWLQSDIELWNPWKHHSL